ncbi:SPOR domain-containing protein [Celeribacter sp.]|uniref:SPOR domain-containing protein n=1 Tax=Celeribacter sp. TaxID=1890673 RepID=UPI003A9463A6
MQDYIDPHGRSAPHVPTSRDGGYAQAGAGYGAQQGGGHPHIPAQPVAHMSHTAAQAAPQGGYQQQAAPQAPGYHAQPTQAQASHYAALQGFAPQGYGAAGQYAQGYDNGHDGYNDGFAGDDALATDDRDMSGMPRLGFAQWAGATVSLALIVMIGVWGYKQMVRDVSGVPVIRALEGEARVIPDDPGGQLAVHQGLAVNTVTADGSAAAPADSLTLAPRQIGLTDEDLPMGTIAPATLTAVEDAENTNPYAEELTQVEPTSAPVNPDVDAMQELAATEADAIETMPAAFISPFPTPRPARAIKLASADGGASLNGVAGDILAAVGVVGEVDVAAVPAGTAVVQLGAFAQQEAARLKWDSLVDQFSDFMEGKQRMIVEASAGGKTFYRLRAVGFDGIEDSNRFCAALDAMNASCVPVVVE